MARLKAASIAVALTALVLFATATTPARQRHWQETENETVWRGRYTNCDYGYYVSLPDTVIAHGSHSPNPNHGFLIALPDVGRVSTASLNDERFIWVNAEYNATDLERLRDIADSELDNTTEHKQSFRVVERGMAKLAGLQAVRFKVVYQGSKGRVIEEQVIALRSKIIYTVGLRTTEGHSLFDEQQFRNIRDRLSLMKLPQGECSNGS